MKPRNSACVKWTLVLLVFVFCPFVSSRPQDTSPAIVVTPSSSVQTDLRVSSQLIEEETRSTPPGITPSIITNQARDVKTKAPVIGESIKMVTSQLLDKPNNKSEEPILSDTRVPPKIKNQVQKHKIKTRNENGEEPKENSHVGIAVPISMEELEMESESESSTPSNGITTWVLLSSLNNTENSLPSTEPTKTNENQKKQKPVSDKRNKPNKTSGTKRPIISSNKSDLVAGGSAINENVYNKIKDTVLSNVQKNKNPTTKRTTTITTASPLTETSTIRKKSSNKLLTTVQPQVKVTSKSKKKNSNKRKSTTTLAPVVSESALYPTEGKEQEIELEISTPATTTKKSKKKKNKTKKRKTSKPTDKNTEVTAVKNTNKTKLKLEKNSKKPNATDNPLMSQFYKYFSTEVKAAISVGALGLAGLVGLAGYFLGPFYPFNATPVRRTFELDKRDDLYKHNGEEYASEGNGQAEEEMLGTVLAGMPAHAKHKLNPYAAQTPQINRYSLKKEQDNIKYRHVTPKYESNYNIRYPQQKTGIAHGAVYSQPINYTPHQYETRHVYTTESKYAYEKPNYTPYPVVDPVYAEPQTSSGISSYGSDLANSVVYGVKPSPDTDFKPVYPFEAQSYQSETTSNPATYSPTSMYLGSDNEDEESSESKYDDDPENNNKYVVGNIPKELSETVPAVVPEHGPRNLKRRKRSPKTKRSITQSIDEILRQMKDKNTDIFISNEIDDAYGLTTKSLAPIVESLPINDQTNTEKPKDYYTIYAESLDTEIPTAKTELIESISTQPIDKGTTESYISNDIEVTTKSFKVYEIFSTNAPEVAEKSNLSTKDTNNLETTQNKMNTETTTELKSDTTSTMPPTPTPITDSKDLTSPKPTYYPEVITYPPLNEDSGFFTFLKRLVEFKYRLGLSILQTTSDHLNRYLRNMENTAKNVANASKT